MSYYFNKYPHHDIAIGRCNANSLKDSCFNEVIEALDDFGTDYSSSTVPVVIKDSRHRITFHGIGGSDVSRTRSFKPTNKLSLIVIEETQQLANQQQLDQALSSFVRHLDTSIPYHIILLGNNPATKQHWWWQYVESSRGLPNRLVLETNYKCLGKFLPAPVVEEIEWLKQANPPLYRHMYLGEPLFDKQALAVYNYSPACLLDAIPAGRRINRISIGVDVAIQRDKTAAVILVEDNLGYLYMLPPFIHNPATDGVISSQQQAILIKNYVDTTLANLFTRHYFAGGQPTFIVDCAATDMILALRQLGCNAIAFTNKKTAETFECFNNMLGSNRLYLIDGKTTANLIDEIETVSFINGKLNDSEPNDIIDAARYVLYYNYHAAPQTIFKREVSKNHE